jgi:hypothetical protein
MVTSKPKRISVAAGLVHIAYLLKDVNDVILFSIQMSYDRLISI